MDLIIRDSVPEDLELVLAVERAAFGSEEEAELVRLVLMDPTAEPRISLLAFLDEQAVGHILFSKAELDPPVRLEASILGPLAVVPSHQKEGIGGKLIQRGLELLKEMGVDWVFVLGHESYYPRFGFSPAQKHGFQPPYPFPEEITNPWMALSLTPASGADFQGKVIPARSFDDPKYWGE